MQVFKLFMKLVKANRRSFFIYIGIFAGLLFGIIIPNQKNDQKTDFAAAKCSYAIFDEDETILSDALSKHLSNNHTCKSIEDSEAETIQDELFYRNVDAVILIKNGFGDGITGNNSKEYIQIYTIPNATAGMLIEQDISGYLSKLAAFLKSGFEREEAIQKTDAISNMTLSVTFANEKKNSGHQSEYYFFVYLAWVFMAVSIQSVAPVLCILNEKEVRNRIYISSYPFASYSFEILLGTIAIGLFLCGIMLILAVLVLPLNLFCRESVLLVLNMICFMVVSMAFTLLASKVTSNGQVISAISNIISLGMAFLCGVFVPVEYLGDSVLRISRFMPAYWYVNVIEKVEKGEIGNLLPIFKCMGIQLGFGAVIIVLAFFVSRRKPRKS